jgi:hypothetical protein
MMKSTDAIGGDDAILDVQSAFAELISRHFSDLWLCYSEGDLDIQKTVLQYMKNPSGIVIPRLSGTTTALFRRVEDLLLDIDTFWVKHTDGLKDAISRSGRFGVLGNFGDRRNFSVLGRVSVGR